MASDFKESAIEVLEERIETLRNLQELQEKNRGQAQIWFDRYKEDLQAINDRIIQLENERVILEEAVRRLRADGTL